jgi:hypothetical protein
MACDQCQSGRIQCILSEMTWDQDMKFTEPTDMQEMLINDNFVTPVAAISGLPDAWERIASDMERIADSVEKMAVLTEEMIQMQAISMHNLFWIEASLRGESIRIGERRSMHSLTPEASPSLNGAYGLFYVPLEPIHQMDVDLVPTLQAKSNSLDGRPSTLPVGHSSTRGKRPRRAQK